MKERCRNNKEWWNEEEIERSNFSKRPFVGRHSIVAALHPVGLFVHPTPRNAFTISFGFNSELVSCLVGGQKCVQCFQSVASWLVISREQSTVPNCSNKHIFNAWNVQFNGCPYSSLLRHQQTGETDARRSGQSWKLKCNWMRTSCWPHLIENVNVFVSWGFSNLRLGSRKFSDDVYLKAVPFVYNL